MFNLIPHTRRGIATVAVGVLMVLATVTLFSRADAVLSPATFELDGNTLVDNAPAHDWSQVFDSTTYGAHGADLALFIPDVAAADDQPATGATKDVYDIDGWDCKAAGLSPPKNDIANAFIASYTVGGNQLIYFGLDRVNSDNGTANVGFWFLKGDHSCDLQTGDWSPVKHSVGDTLVTSAFDAGGRVSTILIFEWCSDPADPDLKCGNSESLTVPAEGKGNGPVQLIFAGADCRNADGTPSTFATGLACATVNRTINTESPPWPYDGAGTPSDTYERGAFFEGGIDATGLGLDLECVGTFVADTRSATSPTAQLHDFTIGDTPSCTASVATQASTNSTTVVPGTSVSDTATVTQTPSSAPVPTGTVKFFLCQPSEVTAAGCPTGAGTQIGTPAAGETLNASGVAVSESTTNTTAIGKYCWRAEYSGDSIYDGSSHTNATTECFTTVKQPSTTVTSASPSGVVLAGVSVSDTATVSGGAGQPTPTGTVKFFLCQPADVTAAGCPAGAGTQIGTPAAGETLNASGVATSESTSNTTAIGKYCWRAEYSGDGFYLPSSHTNALTVTTGGVTPECFTTFNPTTVISIADRIVGLPTDATGTVTYGVFTDSACTTAVTTGSPSTGNITPSTNTVGAGGVAPLSDLYTPASPGTFYIKATFTGTGTYAGVTFSACNESAALTF